MSDFKEYDDRGVYIAYPENWALEEYDEAWDDETLTEGVHLTVQLGNDSGAFWFLKTYPQGTNPEDIAQEALSALQDEYGDMEFERFDKEMFGKFMTGYEIHFFYLDLVNLARILAFDTGERTIVVFWQTGNQLIVGNDEAVPVEDVLEAITFSFLRGPVTIP